MKVTGKITGASIDYTTGKPTVSIAVNDVYDFKLMVDEMGALEKLSIEIKPFRKPRSLDANAYAWVLMGRLAEKLTEPKEDLYRQYIKDIGGNFETVCVLTEAVERLCRSWEARGIGWVTETFESHVSRCTNVHLYYGSSVYDTAQMSRLIDLIVQDCKEQGIQTETPEEIERMKSLWGSSPA